MVASGDRVAQEAHVLDRHRRVESESSAPGLNDRPAVFDAGSALLHAADHGANRIAGHHARDNEDDRRPKPHREEVHPHSTDHVGSGQSAHLLATLADLASRGMQVLENHREHLPPGRRLDEVIVVGRPPGPVRAVEGDELLGLRDRDVRQVVQVDIGGLQE